MCGLSDGRASYPTGGYGEELIHASPLRSGSGYAQRMTEPNLAAKDWFVRRLLLWGRANRRRFPWRTERDPFRILIAEMLLQRSRGTTVAGVYDQIFRRWPTPEALASADEEEIAAVIRPLGLVRRSAALKRMAAQVTSDGMPRSVEDLVRLSGVGRYSATATAASAYGQRQPTVDGTSARVYRRFFGLSAPRDSLVDDELWSLVGEVTPGRSAIREWNWAVLDLASLICLPQVPRCPDCPLAAKCFVGSQRILSPSEDKITKM